MKYKVTIHEEETVIYSQTVEDLHVKDVIDAVNPTGSKIGRRTRSDAGKKRQENPLESLV